MYFKRTTFSCFIWKKGKIKVELTVKFYPDEPDVEEVNQAESSLDDIRLMVNKLS